jgi:hypothetical protein
MLVNITTSNCFINDNKKNHLSKLNHQQVKTIVRLLESANSRNEDQRRVFERSFELKLAFFLISPFWFLHYALSLILFISRKYLTFNNYLLIRKINFFEVSRT